nr:hypothetical protein [Rhizobium skierniewicense]
MLSRLQSRRLRKCEPQLCRRRKRNDKQAARDRAVFRPRSQSSSSRLRAGIQDIHFAVSSACPHFFGRYQERDHRPRLWAWHAQSAR